MDAIRESYDGELAEITEPMRRAVDAVRALYVDHPAGGGLHVVVDDWNVGADCIRSCYEYITTAEERLAAALLVELSQEQQATVLAIVHGHIEDLSYILECEDCGTTRSFAGRDERYKFISQHEENTGHSHYRLSRDGQIL